MQLSPHFTLAELTTTSHRTIDNRPPEEVIDRLQTLCVNLLEPVRAKFGPLWVTSGFRCLELNTLIGGSKTSAHVDGCAADFVPMHDFSTREIVEWVVASELAFDQVIDEYSSTSNWIHLGQIKPGRHDPRRQALTMRGGRYTSFGLSA
ncbi:hypothetical protein LCGC14_2887080 [marine sediment metagenome]|uniref:Peptidase M15A C-terminal domain-containing protein n=1 Tax=marine sediment metagenome TaxID=412755 RepID=A0A0F9A6B8_9ZZZZ